MYSSYKVYTEGEEKNTDVIDVLKSHAKQSDWHLMSFEHRVVDLVVDLATEIIVVFYKPKIK